MYYKLLIQLMCVNKCIYIVELTSIMRNVSKDKEKDRMKTGRRRRERERDQRQREIE